VGGNERECTACIVFELTERELGVKCEIRTES